MDPFFEGAVFDAIPEVHPTAPAVDRFGTWRYFTKRPDGRYVWNPDWMFPEDTLHELRQELKTCNKKLKKNKSDKNKAKKKAIEEQIVHYEKLNMEYWATIHDPAEKSILRDLAKDIEDDERDAVADALHRQLLLSSLAGDPRITVI